MVNRDMRCVEANKSVKPNSWVPPRWIRL